MVQYLLLLALDGARLAQCFPLEHLQGADGYSQTCHFQFLGKTL